MSSLAATAAGDSSVSSVKTILLVLCIFSLGAKTIGHTDRHLHPPVIETAMR
jgi:hypothetical protein